MLERWLVMQVKRPLDPRPAIDLDPHHRRDAVYIDLDLRSMVGIMGFKMSLAHAANIWTVTQHIGSNYLGFAVHQRQIYGL